MAAQPKEPKATQTYRSAGEARALQGEAGAMRYARAEERLPNATNEERGSPEPKSHPRREI